MKLFGHVIPPLYLPLGSLGRYFVILVTLFFSLFCIAAEEGSSIPYSLCIKQSGHIIAEFSLPVQGDFVITYVHSIHKRPVYEYYRARNDLMQLYELRYDTTSTGMPSDMDGGFRIEEGLFVLTMDRQFKTLPLFVSPIPGHGVIIEGHLYLFTEWVKEETALELSVRKQTKSMKTTSP